MGAVQTRNIALAYAIESSLGVLPGTPLWKQLEPDGLNAFGPSITKEARNPISASRRRRKGAVVDLDSTVEWEGDITMEHVEDFIEGFMFAQFAAPTGTALEDAKLASGANFENLAADDSLATLAVDGYSHDNLAQAYPAGTLVYARGFTNSGNNGLGEVDSGALVGETPIVGATFIAETPSEAANATLEVCGRRAATGDITITVTGTPGAGGTAVLGSTTLNFTTLGLTVGQYIHVGGLTTANQFSAGAGFARITSIAANSVGLDKLGPNLATDTGAGETIDILYGRFLRDVDVSDADYLERSFQFEVAYVNLDNPGPGDAYEYAEGNWCNSMTLTLALASLATLSFNFVGTDTPVPTTTRATGASAPRQPVKTAAFGSASDIGRLRLQELDETALTSCFKNVVITLNNGVTPEKCLATLGAVSLNTGLFEVDIELTVHYDDADLAEAIRLNETVGFDTILDNGDGALAFDVPSMDLNGGTREFPENETVTIASTGNAFEDPTLGYQVGISTFPVVPTSA